MNNSRGSSVRQHAGCPSASTSGRPPRGSLSVAAASLIERQDSFRGVCRTTQELQALMPRTVLDEAGLAEKLVSARNPADPADSDARLLQALEALQPLWSPLRPKKCKECRGASHITCSTCRGRGKTGGLFTGAALQRCTACGSKGRQPCNSCASTGLENHWLWQPSDDVGAWGARGE